MHPNRDFESNFSKAKDMEEKILSGTRKPDIGSYSWHLLMKDSELGNRKDSLQQTMTGGYDVPFC